MEVLITYDVATDTREGRRRLRRVAKVCEAYGQRVQKSVFECIVSRADLTVLTQRLRAEMDVGEDSLRIYMLREPRSAFLQVYGRVPSHDIHEPLIL